MWDVLFKLLCKDIVGEFFAEQEDSHQRNKKNCQFCQNGPFTITEIQWPPQTLYSSPRRPLKDNDIKSCCWAMRGFFKGILLGLLGAFLCLYQDLMFPQECVSYT